jgi:hypothetical protein
MEKHVKCSDKDSFLKEVESKSKWPKPFDSNFKSLAAGFFTKFKNVTSDTKGSNFQGSIFT